MNSPRFPELEEYHKKLFLHHYLLLTQYYIDTIYKYELNREVLPEHLNEQFDQAFLWTTLDENYDDASLSSDAFEPSLTQFKT